MMSFVIAACVPAYALYALWSLRNGSFIQVRTQVFVEESDDFKALILKF